MAAKEHIASQLDDLSNTERRKRKLSGKNIPGAKRLKFDNDVVKDNVEEDDVEEEPISLPVEIQRRRKLMAARSQFRNILKRTLVRNHVRLHGRGSWKTKPRLQKAPASSPPVPSLPVPSLPVPSPPVPSPPVNRVKCYDPPTPMSPPVTPQAAKVNSVITSMELPETPPKNNPELEMTHPRNSGRESMLFTPLNLTPPVIRRQRHLAGNQISIYSWNPKQ